LQIREHFANIYFVNVISKPGLMKLLKKYPQAEAQLIDWFKVARAADWMSLADVRRNYPSADLIGAALVFNVLHNDLRLITVASWRSKRIYIKTLMTHKEYMRKEWMKWA
jgi:mRNA interferase HigB